MDANLQGKDGEADEIRVPNHSGPLSQRPRSEILPPLAANHSRPLAFIRGSAFARSAESDHGKRTREELTLNATRPSACFGVAASPGRAFAGAPIPTACNRAESKPYDSKKS